MARKYTRLVLCLGFLLLIAACGQLPPAESGQGNTAIAALATSSAVGVSTGWYHSCGIKADGSVVCWGYAGDGQLSVPTGVLYTQVSAGSSHNCAVRKDNSKVDCWGRNLEGQSTPPTDTFSQISSGYLHSCGVKTDGSAACWGDPTFGQTMPPSGAVTQVSAGGFHSCGLKAGGIVVCWGYGVDGQLNVPSSTTFTQVSAGFRYTCGLKTGGSVVCWGDNSFGQLNVPLGVTFTKISASQFHTCGLKTDGSVVCWGDNTNGKLNVPTGGTFTQVSAGLNHTCAVKSDNTLVCWGDNTYGQAPQLSISPSSLPDAAVNSFYSQNISASGGNAPYSFKVISGSLPPGLTLSPSGTLSGTLTNVGSFTFTIQATDSSALPFSTSTALTLSCLCQASSSIASDFNSTAIASGNYIWFNSVAKVSGRNTSKTTTIQFRDGKISFTANGTPYVLTVPGSVLTFSPTAASAKTEVGSDGRWYITVPASYNGNVFLSGLAWKLPVNLPGGIKPVTWSGTFTSDSSGLGLDWKWAAAVYTKFSGDHSLVGAKPIDGSSLNPYPNSDHAGTPEAFKPYVIGGARGGGGSNFTGGYSGTAKL